MRFPFAAPPRYVPAMSSTTSQAQPLTFERFFRWLQEHSNCVVRAGNHDATLFDHDAFHWDFYEEDDGRAVFSLLSGKQLVGELVLERSEVLFVQSAADPENPSSGHWLFELIGGSKEDSFPMAFVVLSHGMEQAAGHALLKH